MGRMGTPINLQASFRSSTCWSGRQTAISVSAMTNRGFVGVPIRTNGDVPESSIEPVDFLGTQQRNRKGGTVFGRVLRQQRHFRFVLP